MTRDQVLSDQTWERIAPSLPTQQGNGRPFRDHRWTIEGIVFPRIRSGMTCLSDFGPWQTV